MNANQITAIGVSIIALGVIIAGGIYINKKRFYRNMDIYYNCISEETIKGKLYRSTKRQDGFLASRKVLKKCLSSYGLDKPDEYFIKDFEHY